MGDVCWRNVCILGSQRCPESGENQQENPVLLETLKLHLM